MARRTKKFNFVYVPYEKHKDYKPDWDISLEEVERIKNMVIDYLLEEVLPNEIEPSYKGRL